jgi:membrane-associated phospholipid phosphatase
MTRQHDLAAEALQRGAVPGRGYVLARAISQILHPIVLGIISIGIVGLFGLPQQRSLGLLWALACVMLQVVPPMIFFTIRLRQGAYSDEDISVRTQRNELYLFGFATLIVGALILAAFGAPKPFMALLASAAIINIAGFVINLYWKISIHSASIGSTATLATLYSQPLGLFFWFCAAVLGWARLRTRNHTLLQVIAGMALAAVCVLAAFRLFGVV